MPAVSRRLQAPTKAIANKHKPSSHIPVAMKSRNTKSSRVRPVPNFAKLHEKWTNKLEISKACTKKPCTLVQEFDLTTAGTKFARPAARDVSQFICNPKPNGNSAGSTGTGYETTAPKKSSPPTSLQKEGGEFVADPSALQSILNLTGVSTASVTTMGPPPCVTRQTLAGGPMRIPGRVTNNVTELRSRGMSMISIPESRPSFARLSAMGLPARRVVPRQSAAAPPPSTTFTPTRVVQDQSPAHTPSRVVREQSNTPTPCRVVRQQSNTPTPCRVVRELSPALTPSRVWHQAQEVPESRLSMARPSILSMSARRVLPRQSTTPNRARPQTEVKPARWKDILRGKDSHTEDTDMVRTKLDYAFTAPASAPPKGTQPRRILKAAQDKENNPSAKDLHSPKLEKPLQMSPRLRSNTPTKQQRALQSLSPNVLSPRKALFSPNSQERPGSPMERVRRGPRSEQTVLSILAEIEKENESPPPCLSPRKKSVAKVNEKLSPALLHNALVPIKSSFQKKPLGIGREPKSRHVEFKLADDMDCTVDALNETLNESILEYESLQTAASRMQAGEGGQETELLKKLELIQQKQQQLLQLQALLTQKLQQQQDGSPPGGHQQSSPPGEVLCHSPSTDQQNASPQEHLTTEDDHCREESSPENRTNLSPETQNLPHVALQTKSCSATMLDSSEPFTTTPSSVSTECLTSSGTPQSITSTLGWRTPGSTSSCSSGGSAACSGNSHWKKKMLYVKAEYSSPPPAAPLPPVLEEAPIQTPLVMRAQALTLHTPVEDEFQRLSLDDVTQDAAMTLLSLNTPVDHTPKRSRFHSAPAASPYLPRLSDISPEPFRDESSLQRRPRYYDVKDDCSSGGSNRPLHPSSSLFTPPVSTVKATPSFTTQMSPHTTAKQGSLSLTGNCPQPPPPTSSRYFWTPALEQPKTVPTNVSQAPVAKLSGRFFDTPSLVASQQSSQNSPPGPAIASDAAVGSSPLDDSLSLAGHCQALPSRVVQLGGRLLSTPTVSTPTVTCSRRQSSLSSVSLSSSQCSSSSPVHEASQLVPAAMRFHDALLDEEVSLYACRLHAPRIGTPEDCRCPDPITSTLATGDDMHFVPIHSESPSEVVMEKLEGSAFAVYKGSPI